MRSPSEEEPTVAKTLIEVLNSPSEMKPPSQVFNVFNVMVEPSFIPIYSFSPSKEAKGKNGIKEINMRRYQVPKLVDIIQNNTELLDYIIQNNDDQSDVEVKTLPNISESRETEREIDVEESANIFVNEIIKDAVQKVTNTHNFDLKSGCLNAPIKMSNSHQFLNQDNVEEALQFSSQFAEDEPSNLENWNSFLDKTLQIPPDDNFSSFNSEFDGKQDEFDCVTQDNQICNSGEYEQDSWEMKEGWYLHPQSTDISGEMNVDQTVDSESYVGFGMDEEVMAAIRNELLEKLPRAQV